jgi:hypothetical protein
MEARPLSPTLSPAGPAGGEGEWLLRRPARTEQ